MEYTFADCHLDSAQRRLTCAGTPVPVEPQVFDLLHLLAQNPDRVVTRDEIIETVWQGRIVSDSAISARIAAARKAVGDDGKRQAVIRTVARVGLQMAIAVSIDDAAPEPPPKHGAQRIRYTTDAEGRSIAWALTGQGPPLFRLGYNSTHLEAEWETPSERENFNRLGQHFRLLRFDPVGFGMSERVDIEVDFVRFADNALRAADAAGIDSFTAFSESGGVHTALYLAANHPDRVEKLVIAGGYVDGRAHRETKLPGTFHALLSEAHTVGDDAFASAVLYPYFPEGPFEAVRNMGHNFMQAGSLRNFLRLRDVIDAVSSAGLLARVRCPTLIIHARNDMVHPLSEARKLASGIPNAELMIQDSANHIPIFGNPHYDAFIEAIIAFAKR